MLKRKFTTSIGIPYLGVYCNKRVIFLIYTLIFICMPKISHAVCAHVHYITIVRLWSP